MRNRNWLVIGAASCQLNSEAWSLVTVPDGKRGGMFAFVSRTASHPGTRRVRLTAASSNRCIVARQGPARRPHFRARGWESLGGVWSGCGVPP